MGEPPLRLELMASIDGVDFDDCEPRGVAVEFGGQEIPVISLTDLRRNKKAAGRHKDLDDLENLPDA